MIILLGLKKKKIFDFSNILLTYKIHGQLVTIFIDLNTIILYHEEAANENYFFFKYKVFSKQIKMRNKLHYIYLQP